MKKTIRHQLLLGLLAILATTAVMSGCEKKKDSTVSRSGGGVSSQSIVTLKGAAQ